MNQTVYIQLLSMMEQDLHEFILKEDNDSGHKGTMSTRRKSTCGAACESTSSNNNCPRPWTLYAKRTCICCGELCWSCSWWPVFKGQSLAVNNKTIVSTHIIPISSKSSRSFLMWSLYFQQPTTN